MGGTAAGARRPRLFEVDPDKLLDEGVAPWDVFPRPDKPLEEYTAKEVGTEGERLALVYLARKGFQILDVNWRCRYGEADIVALDPKAEDTAVLVEVKTALDLGRRDLVMPELHVSRGKRDRYRRMGLQYLIDHAELETARFDVVAVTILDERLAKLRHLVGAFWGDGR
ncbi:YraN family protein [Olsenella sp. YH-ols2217]|uniref:UPF0102 protein QJ043_02810 n=1 Tax=Kribbibacterium absianum TaxID=3044210 RepID=A0ABT6ZIZ3_9ACTN|nr:MULTISPECIES: YraN family protein [unclassified Olsenella]MDJ1121525.1 YraN family protein [Olsenella sp. YH-ols2216]MDJ1129015.1 YraN family protein [Olsenella sp. YH-ols2217]